MAEPAKKFEFRFPGGWRRSLAAVMIGNLIYFASMPYLPPHLHHQGGLDWGLAFDFLICVAVFRLSYLFWK